MKSGKIVVISYLDNFPNRFPTWHEFQLPCTPGANIELFLINQCRVSMEDIIWCDIEFEQKIYLSDILSKIPFGRFNIRMVIIESKVLNNIYSNTHLPLEYINKELGLTEGGFGYIFNSGELDFSEYSKNAFYNRSSYESNEIIDALNKVNKIPHLVYGAISFQSNSEYQKLLEVTSILW